MIEKNQSIKKKSEIGLGVGKGGGGCLSLPPRHISDSPPCSEEA